MKQYPDPANVKMGRMYTRIDKETDERNNYILAQVQSFQFALISLDDGNRWNDPALVKEFEAYSKIPPNKKDIKKIFECEPDQFWVIDE